MGNLQDSEIGALNFNVLRGIIEAGNFLSTQAGIEIGVFDGGTSYYLLKSFPELRLISVDPYLAYHEYDQARLDRAKATATSRLDQFGERSIRLEIASQDAAVQLPDNAFDFVFIDANHDYEPVMQDMHAWYPKVRVGGLFAGHDYRWAGVTQAVNEFAAARNLEGHITPKESDIWWFIKQPS